MEHFTLFEELLHAETEDDVNSALSVAGFLNDDSAWRALGFENNFAAIGNQQSDPSGALVEKVINAIDAVLMAECYAHGIDPEGPGAPASMGMAVERFFGVPDGRLDRLSPAEQTGLADGIHLVATGRKESPNYLIIDRGEGQTPKRFPDTFVSLMRSNKIRIPFVQGKFNSGGTGILQFCGTQNYELIVSRRRPECPVDPDDETADLWGFTIVRRLLPSGGRRSSMYVYLAPGGNVPSFQANAIKVLPGKSQPNRPAPPYALDLQYGTCVKLYDYRWRARSSITTEGRYELERFLLTPCLPFRVTETREYRANYYSATITGGWVSAIAEDEEGESRKLEDGFPGDAVLSIEGVGRLPYQMAVYRQGTNRRHVPHGVTFVVNGQVHGSLPDDFVTKRLKFDYLVGQHGPLLACVDCTAMDERVREDFFMASRDRIRRNEVYATIEERLAEALRDHPGLQEVNQRRRKELLEENLGQKAPIEAFQKLLDVDPTLSSLFNAGDRLATSTGPADKPPYVGRRFPTFFRLASEPRAGLVKSCPLNRTCRVEFETDAVNDYFSRALDPGRIAFDPPNLVEHSHLWNGRFEVRLRVPWDAQVGDAVNVAVTVTDADRETKGGPFVSRFAIKATAELDDEGHPGNPRRPRGADMRGGKRGVVLSLPQVTEVKKDQWEQFGFTRFDAISIRQDGQGGYDYFINIDNAFLLTELGRTRDDDGQIVRFWFKYGLVLAALGMIRHEVRLAEKSGQENEGSSVSDRDGQDGVDLGCINRYCNGLAQVIVPIVRTLHRGPGL